MKKSNLKKLALLGLASGLVVSTQASAEVTTGEMTKGTQMARSNCGSGCGSKSQPVADASCSHSHPYGGDNWNNGYEGGYTSYEQPYYGGQGQGSCGTHSQPRDRRYNGQYNGQLSDTSMDSGMSMDQSSFRNSLNEDSKAIFDSMDTEGKRRAMQMASQGMEKNQAVKAASQKMGDKRGSTMDSGRSNYSNY